MSQGTYWDTLIRLEGFKRIFVFGQNLDVFPRGKSRVFGQKLPNFKVGIFHSFMALGISACRKTPLRLHELFAIPLHYKECFVSH